MIDGFIQKLSWLSYSNNDEAKTACNLLPTNIREHMTPLKVRSDMGSENMMLAKCVIFLRSTSFNGRTGGRFTHNTRTEYFWRECNTTVKDYFLEKFENLEFFGSFKKLLKTLTFGCCIWFARRQ